LYGPKVPKDGTSFLCKTPYLTKELIERKIGALEGQGIKQTIFVSVIKFGFMFKKKNIASFC